MRQFMPKASTDNSEKLINKIRESHQHKKANKTHLKENTKPIILSPDDIKTHHSFSFFSFLIKQEVTET